jgi:hypothetical protein
MRTSFFYSYSKNKNIEIQHIENPAYHEIIEKLRLCFLSKNKKMAMECCCIFLKQTNWLTLKPK